MRLIKLALTIIFLLAGAISLTSYTRITFASPEAAALPASAPVQNADQYVGSNACAECHTSEAAFFNLTAHRKTDDEKYSADKRGCESCHGGAKQHVEFHKTAAQLFKDGKEAEANALYSDAVKAEAAKMKNLKELPASEASASCLKCHEGEQGRSEERFNYRRSDHFRHGVSCMDCHSSHSPKRTEYLLRDTQPNMCYQCHADQKASFAKPFHHKVPEGAMKCSDCHNQHGGFMAKSLRNSVNGDAACVKCHADKQGPFVYEHAPVKAEGCQACHTPHGSTYPKMLTRPNVRFLCIECHSNTPGLEAEGTGLGERPTHNQNDPRYFNCTMCHNEIHGSNQNNFFRQKTP